VILTFNHAIKINQNLGSFFLFRLILDFRLIRRCFGYEILLLRFLGCFFFVIFVSKNMLKKGF